MKWPTYPRYKNSGVEWLGEIPEHWEVAPCRSFVIEETRKNLDARDQNYLSLMANVGIIPYEEKGDVGNKKPEDLSKCKVVCKGDFVINSMNYGIGSYGVSPFDGVCSSVYIVLRPIKAAMEPRFAFRVFEHKGFQSCAQSFGNGILEHRAAINWDVLKGIGVGIPPPIEQQAILSFLDRETPKLDALIAKQERLIELLQEKKRALISHAVTKGLNPAAPMKESGLEWLGKVPAHWAVCTLGYVAYVETGATPDRERPEYWNGDIPWVKTGEINYQAITSTEERISQNGLKHSAARVSPKGTLLMAMYGQGVTRGRVAILGIEAAYNQACAAITFSTSMKAEFGRYYFMAVYQFVRDLGNETSQMNLSAGLIRKFAVVRPPVDEQESIVRFLDQKLRAIETLLAKAEGAIALLREHRTALISSAVTGKIDVRGNVTAASSVAALASA